MPKMKQFALKAALFMVITLSTSGTSGAAGFNQYIGFGDSTLDSGYWRYNSTGNSTSDGYTAAAVASGDSGAYNANGVENSIILAGKFGLSAAPVGAPGGGTNYANGASLTATNVYPYTNSVSAIQQIQNYLFSVSGTANPNALYVIKSGDNDLNYSGVSPTYLSNSASALATEVAALQAAGVRFIPADIDSLFKYVVHNPTLFGFTAFSVVHTNSPAYNNPLTSPPNLDSHNSALWAYPLTPTQQQTYLFVDYVHLTTAGQTIEADYEYSLLAAPSQISLVVESAVQSGLARADTIQRQIDISGQSHGLSDPNVWASAGVGWQSIKNAQGFPNVSGTPFGGAVGVDYRTQCGVILGVAFTGGSQRQNFSTGGYFDQVDEAPSLYAAYKVGSVWGEAVATYDSFQDKIARQVPLGIFTDDNSANTSGYSLALALRGGDDFKLGQVTTGPVVGVVLQQVHLDGFTETGGSGATALSFAGQTRDSYVSQLGWRVLTDIGKWQPFVEAKWNHDWANKDNTVTASLTSVTAPSYTMDAAPVASNWATTSLGTSYKLNSRATLRGVFLATFLNPQVESYGGELGLNISF